MSSQPAVIVEQLNRSFSTGRGKKRKVIEAVRDLSFVIESGERLAFIGPNGAGKSTSIKMLTGILHPTSGRASVLGLVPWQQRRELAGAIGTLFGQRSLLWSELDPLSSYMMLAAIYGLRDGEATTRVDELGDLLDARDLFDQPVRTLSLGQRMKCELTACMLHNPQILFLDEPTIGLDLLAKQRFREMLVTLNELRGTTVLLTSHDVADIEHVASRAIVVNHGSIIFDDTVSSMRTRLLATKRVEVGLHEPADATAVTESVAEGIGVGDIQIDEVTNSMVRLDVDTASRPIRGVVNNILSAVDVADLSVIDPPLEQVIGEIYEAPA